MIKDKKVWEEFEKELIRSEKPDFEKNLRIFESMLEHAKLMNVIPLKDYREGLETKIKLAKILHSVK